MKSIINVIMMLCEVCKSTDFDDLCYRASQLDQPSSYEKGFVTPQVLHHLSFTAPRAAAEGGCEVCKAVLKGAERWGTLSTLYHPDHAYFPGQMASLSIEETMELRGIEELLRFGLINPQGAPPSVHLKFRQIMPPTLILITRMPPCQLSPSPSLL
jgi:hypothetical protein